MAWLLEAEGERVRRCKLPAAFVLFTSRRVRLLPSLV